MASEEVVYFDPFWNTLASFKKKVNNEQLPYRYIRWIVRYTLEEIDVL